MFILSLWRDRRLDYSFPLHRCLIATSCIDRNNHPQVEIGLGVTAKTKNLPQDMRTMKRPWVLSQGSFLRVTWGWPIESQIWGVKLPMRFDKYGSYYALSFHKLWIELGL